MAFHPPLPHGKPSIALIRVFTVITDKACQTSFLLLSFLDPVELMDHEKSSSSCFRSDTTPLCSERFCSLHHGFFLSYMDGVHCLLVLNMFALLDHRCLLFSIHLNFTGLVFSVCIFWNFPSDLFGSSQAFHLLPPSVAVGTTRHYLLDCMVIFCTPFTFHFFRPSSLLDVCSPCVDE